MSSINPVELVKQITISDLIDYANAQSESIISISSLESYISTLRTFTKKAGFTEKSLAIDIFGDNFPIYLSSSDKYDKSRLKKWHTIYNGYIATFKQKSFSDVFKELLQKKNISVSELGRRTGIKAMTLGRWYRGEAHPKDSLNVKKIESALDVEDEAPLFKILLNVNGIDPVQLIPREWWPKKLRTVIASTTKTKKAVIYFLGRENLYLPAAKLRPLFNEALQRVLNGEHLPSWRKKQVNLLRLRYRLPFAKWPLELSKQWENISDFMIAPNGLSNRYRNSQWRKTTNNKYISFLESYFGFLTLDKSDNKLMSGLSIPVEDLSIYYLINPKFFLEFAEFQNARSGSYSTGLIPDISVPMTILREKSGYLYNNTHKIPNVFEFKDKSDIERKSTLREFYKELKEYREELQKISKQMRETLSLVEPILQHERPRDLVLDAIEEYGKNITRDYPYDSGKRPNREAAVFWRNYVMLHILIRFPLRRSHWGKMTYFPDNTGHFFYDKNGQLSLRLLYSEFKNEANKTYFSSRNKQLNHDGQMILSFTDDSPLIEIKELLEVYLTHFHPILVGNQGGYVFCTKDGKQADAPLFTGLVDRWSFDYLSMFGSQRTCIEGVYSFGIHTFRHIVATDAVKNEGVEAAAALLLDNPEQILKNYALFLPEDAVNRAFKSKNIFRPNHTVFIKVKK